MASTWRESNLLFSQQFVSQFEQTGRARLTVRLVRDRRQIRQTVEHFRVLLHVQLTKVGVVRLPVEDADAGGRVASLQLLLRVLHCVLFELGLG